MHKDLGAAEKLILENSQDIHILEFINGIGDNEVNFFEKYVPRSFNHYLKIQKHWIEKARYLLGTRRKEGLISDMDLIKDMESNKTLIKFKLWYRFKFPNLISPLYN